MSRRTRYEDNGFTKGFSVRANRIFGARSISTYDECEKRGAAERRSPTEPSERNSLLRAVSFGMGSRYAIIALIIILNGMVVVAHTNVLAQVMQSSSYRIESDSVNMGGARSESSLYALEDTVGEVATGDSASATYKLGAGYQHTLIDYLSLSASPDITMSPTLGGLTGGTSNGSTTITVITDSAAGYQLTIQASNSPAMRSVEGNTISNYVPGGSDPDFTFSVPAGDERFGYSPEGTDIASRFKDNGSVCNNSSGDTSLACWDGITTSAAEFARRTGPNHPDGSTTTLRFRVGLGSNAMVTEGTYYATTTVTALPL